MWTRTADGSVVDAEGRIIIFSTERFIDDICLGDCCFICGARPGTKIFNDEHILPEWLLRRFNLFDQKVVLPNDVAVKYGSYTVSCCGDCNALMGEHVERLISAVTRGGRLSLSEFVSNGFALQVFVWMGLIYLKTHLHDRRLRFHLDARKGGETISEAYEWALLHHLHCVVRCFYTGCEVAPEALGSILVLPVNSQGPASPFDYGDLYFAQTMMIRLDDVAVICVFNDSGASLSNFYPVLEKIRGPVSSVQLREIMVEMAFLNLHLENRPVFQTTGDLDLEECRIEGVRHGLDLRELELSVRGRLLHRALGDMLPVLRVPNCRSLEETEQVLLSGRVTFVFDEEGNFLLESMVRAPPPSDQ